jgi:DGQHR domain-containing protein
MKNRPPIKSGNAAEENPFLATKKNSETVSVAGTLITQGAHKFYTATLPIDLLAQTCAVVPREDNPDGGFQRLLDEPRARDIADYIDNRGGVIPNSIVLSAQQEAELAYSSRSTVLSFKPVAGAFLILDGQHRVYGFKYSQSKLRVPVVIFNGLSRTQEVRLFIDINTKQQRVPNELLLDIKNLALYENQEEEFARALFDQLNDSSDSCMRGLMSPASKQRDKISRVTFRRAINPILPRIIENEASATYAAINAYLKAFQLHLTALCGNHTSLIKPTVFPAVLMLFPTASAKVRDRRMSFSMEAFHQVLQPLFDSARPAMFTKPDSAYRKLYDSLATKLNSESLRFS